MSEITSHAGDALVERLDRLDTSKSEVMREALRQYLDELERDDGADGTTGFDGTLSVRVEEPVDERLDERPPMLVEEATATRESERPTPSNLNVNINADGPNDESRVNAGTDTESAPSTVRKTRDELEPDDADDPDMTCGQCGEFVGPDHVCCPSCGGKTSHRVFCECGDESHSDWAFCPDCGRRTSATDVLEQA